jgi:autotransporter-associated beta strand protein
MKTRHSLLISTAAALSGSFTPLCAATMDFTGPTGGLWNSAVNWTPATVPAAADTATFTNPATSSVRLNAATNTSSTLTFGNGAGFSIVNASGDTANIAHTAARTIKVNDANSYSINLTNGGGSGTSSTGALLINSTTFDIAPGGKLTLDGRYFHNPGGVRTVTKNVGTTGGTGTLELTGNYALTFLQSALTAGSLILNGTGTNARLMGMSSIGANGTLVIGSSNTNLFSGTVVAPATHGNTGIRLISGLVDLNGNNLSTTRVQGTAATGVITNNGASDSVLTLGDFGSNTALDSPGVNITKPVFGGLIKDGATNKLGLTLTGGSGDKLTLTLSQAATYTGPTMIQNGAGLVTAGLAGASSITVGAGSSLLVDGPLLNTAGITVTGGSLEVRGAFSSGPLAVSGGIVKAPSNLLAGIPVASVNQTGGNIELPVIGNSASKLTTAGNMSFSGGSLTVNLQSAPTAPVVLAEYGSLTGTPAMAFSPDLATTRLSSPVVDPLTGNKVTLSLSGSTADLVWTGADDALWNLSSVNWGNGGSGSAFFNLDKVTFTDTPTTKTIDLATTVTPSKMTVTNTGTTNDYIITGVGGLAGVGEGLVKNGDGWLDLGGINTFIGPVQVNDGKLKLLSPQALGFTSGVTITNSSPAAGQLDLNSQLLTDASRSFSATISGDGWDTNGAIVNSPATSTIISGVGKSGLRNLTLAANASVGGLGSFDIGTGGSINGGSFTLTKKGSGEVLINGPVSNLKTVVEAGTLSTSLSNGFGSTLLVKSGAAAKSSNLSGTYDHTTDVTVQNGGTLQSGTSVNWNGSMVLEGDLTIKIDQTGTAVMTFPNAMNIPGNLVSNGGASGGTTSFLGDLDVTGTITMTTGNLNFDGSTGTLDAASIALNGATTSVNFNRSSDMAFGNVISGSGGVRQAGTGTTTLNGSNTYSGATNVTAGTLLVNVTQTGTGAVTVSSGATLRASGKMSGAVTITGTLAPGISGIGMLESGQVGATPRTTTINGTLQIETDGSAGTPTDVLKPLGALTLGAASTLDFNSIGTPLTAASYVIASYGGTLTGTFGTVTDLPPGYSLVYNFDNGVSSTNIALVKTATPFGLWIDTYFPGETNPAIIGAAADPDGDGESNAMEFALGGTPNNGSSRARIHPLTLDSDDGGTDKELLLTIAVRSGTPAFTGTPSPAATHEGFTSSVQGSLGLASFSAPVSVVTPVTTGLPAAPAGYEYRTFRLDGSDGLPSTGFLRVQVSP